MDDDSAKTPEQLRQELAELRQQRAVEQAAERIREHVLAMRQSEALQEVVVSMFREMVRLGVEPPGVSFHFFDEATNRGSNYFAFENPQLHGIGWSSPDLVAVDKELAVGHSVGSFADFGQDNIEQWRLGRVWSCKSVEQENEWFTKGFGFEAPLPYVGPGWIITNVPFAHGMVGFRERVYSEEHIAIVQTLTESLSMGYLRYLDFQRLEEQTRQAQVEAALERVWAEVASMHQSQDLFEILPLVEASVKELGVTCDQFSFNIIDEAAKQMQIYWSSGLLSEPDLNEEGDAAEDYRHWKEGQVHHRHIEDRWIVDVPFSQGMLAMNRAGDEAFSDADIALLQRFAEALSLGYTRFLNFQQMEEQTRQARLEAAVQRVRSEAMAMGGSDDLLKVVGMMYQEMIDLEAVDPRTQLVIRFIDEPADVQISYYARLNPKKFGVSWTSSDLVEFNENVAVMARREGSVWDREQFRQGKEWTHTHNKGVDVLRKNIIEEAGGDHLPPAYIEAHAGETTLIHIPFEHGVVGMTQDQYREERVNILREFTGALSLGFLRFLDFQRLEEQNQQLTTANEEVRQALEEKEQAQEALVRSESLASIGTLAAGAAHELNNPIGAAASLVQSVEEMLEEDTAEELAQDRATLIDNLAFSRKELDRAKAIVASLLDLSRQSQDYTEAVDLQTVVQDALRGLHGRYDANLISIKEEYQANLPTVQGNFAQLVQVALNLINNAVDALGSDKGTVALKTYGEGDQAILECRDTGIGMSDEVRQDIFKPFFTTKATGEGIGLGLYVCHQIVDKHGGAIAVDSTEGQGTRVGVRLPISKG